MVSETQAFQPKCLNFFLIASRTTVSRFLFLFLVFQACTGERKMDFIKWAPEIRQCSECPKVKVNIVQAIGNDAKALLINREIERFVSELIYNERDEALSIEESIEHFNEEYRQQPSFSDEIITPWETSIEARVSYITDAVISIIIESYRFTGGAHGYGFTSFLNFSTNSGKVLSNDELFSEYENFVSLAENKFRAKEKIPAHDNINSTGFMFEDDQFHLPENMGFTEKGLLLIYNQYEIASYADGQLQILFPVKELNSLLAGRK